MPGVATQGVDEFEHLGFEPLHVLHGDVEEIRGAAGGVEHGEAAEVAVEGDDLGEGFGILFVGILAEAGGIGSELFRLGGGTGGEFRLGVGFELIGLDFRLVGFLVEGGGGDADGVPFVAQRADDGGADEALDVGARGEFRAELVALAGIEGADEQGAEDGGLDAAPIGGGGIGEHVELRGGEREGGGVFKQPAVEAGDFLEQQGGVMGAGGHFLPQGGDEDREAARVFLCPFEQGLEAVLGQQAHVLGEHGEEAALEESGDDLGVVAVGFEGFGQEGEAAGDVAGDFGGDFRGIERMGIEPDAAEAFADFRAVEVRQGDAVRDGIGEAFVLAAGAGELGVEVDGVADVADDQEWRAAFVGGQGGDVAAPLVEGAFEGFVEGERCRACRGRSWWRWVWRFRRWRRRRRGLAWFR